MDTESVLHRLRRPGAGHQRAHARDMESSPGCWQAFGEVVGREYADPEFGAVRRLTADTYAIQHPGRPSPEAIQSVCGHLLSLCLIIEKGGSFSFGERGIRWVIQRKGRFTWLTPPSMLGEITVVDVGVESRWPSTPGKCVRGRIARGPRGERTTTPFVNGPPVW